MFLITCALTVWAVSGELVTVTTSFYQLMQQSFISQLALIVFSLFLILTIVYTFFYTYRSIPWTIDDLLTDKATKQHTMQVRKKRSLKPEDAILSEWLGELTQEDRNKAQNYNPPLKNWSLL